MRNGVPIQSLINWPSGFGDQDNPDEQLDSARHGRAHHVGPKKVIGGDTLNGPFSWAGSSDTYFAAIFLPDSPDTATLVTQHNQLNIARSVRRTGLGSMFPAKGNTEMPVVGVALGDTRPPHSDPNLCRSQSCQGLREIHATNNTITLEPLLDFGFFGAIGKYLFLTLQFLHAHIVSIFAYHLAKTARRWPDPRGLHKHFGSKDELILESIGEAFTEMGEWLAHTGEQSKTGDGVEGDCEGLSDSGTLLSRLVRMPVGGHCTRVGAGRSRDEGPHLC